MRIIRNIFDDIIAFIQVNDLNDHIFQNFFILMLTISFVYIKH